MRFRSSVSVENTVEMYAAFTAVYQVNPTIAATATATKARSRSLRTTPRGQPGHDGKDPDPDRERAHRPEPVVEHPVLPERRRHVPAERAMGDERVDDDRDADQQRRRADAVPG